MRRLAWTLALALACTGDKDGATDADVDVNVDPEPTDTGAEDTGPPPVASVTGGFVLLDAVTGNPVDGAELVELDAATDEAGQVDVTVDAHAPFSLQVFHGSYLRHHLSGLTGEADFQYISFLATERITDQVLRAFGTSRDPAAGILVVGLDTPDLRPAVGASAAIDGDAELSFVFVGGAVEASATIPEGGGSIVSFVNVAPGLVNVTATGAAGETCGIFPAATDDTHEVAIFEDTVTVVVFTCTEG